MFCNKCGNQIADSQKFCSKCGAPVVNLPNAPASGVPRMAPQEMRQAAPVGIEFTEIKNLFFGLLGLLLLGMIFIFTPTFKIDGILGMSKGFNMFDFEGIESMRTVSAILYLVSAGLLCVPLLTKKAMGS